MKKLLLLAAATLALASPAAAQESAVSADLSNPTVNQVDKELKELVKQVWPAFVLIGGGSGVCISEDGYFLTNHHVFNDAAAPATISVKMAGNSRQFRAIAVGADPRGDIVLGKIILEEGETVPFDKLADSDKVQVGDLCLSVGNPFLLSGTGSEPTVTLGTVTATHRFQGGYSDAIQIDTAINPGNSGGPSFNLDGEVIGINGRNIASHGLRYNTGAGYAIPANQIRNFIDAFKAQEGGAYVVRHGLIGGLSVELFSREAGAVVTKVETDTDAADAGFLTGDRIVKIDQYVIHNGYRYYGVIGTKPRGSRFEITVVREGKRLSLMALANEPVESGQFGTLPRPDDKARKDDGGGMGAMFDLFKLPEMKSTLGFKGKLNTDRKVGGYEITGFRKDADGAESAVQTAGLEVGDILTHINDRHIRRFCDMHDVLIAVEPGTMVTIRFVRNGEEMEATVVLGRAKGG